jgi:hypothetical protein
VRLWYIKRIRGTSDEFGGRAEAVQLLRDVATRDRWVIEGIYGSLVNEIRADSTALIWLYLDEAECVESIRQRGTRRGGDAASFAALLDWASTYQSRQGASSYIGHQKLFDDYRADKQVLRSRDDVMAFLGPECVKTHRSPKLNQRTETG